MQDSNRRPSRFVLESHPAPVTPLENGGQLKTVLENLYSTQRALAWI